MKILEYIYVDGKFLKPDGEEYFALINPSNNQLIGKVRLGNAMDTRKAIAAANKALGDFSSTNAQQRISYLQNLHDAVQSRKADLLSAMVEEYGGTVQFSRMSVEGCLNSFQTAIEVLKEFEFENKRGMTTIKKQAVGVAAIITPWNASNSFICSKLAAALSAGCTVVIKPSEMSALQTQVMMECIDKAGLPAGVVNVVNGRGDTVGAELSENPGIAKITFTGSTAVGKIIAKSAADTMKRVTLELGGKSPFIILDDAELSLAIPQALQAAFINSGQACMAATRLLVPLEKLEEIERLIVMQLKELKVGDPKNEDTAIGPMVSVKQYERVQGYIELGIKEGAKVLSGGMGHPEGLEKGNYVKPTIFSRVDNKMRIAQEEIFGPVLCIIPYSDDQQAIAIANDTVYGLHAFISAINIEKATKMASGIDAGRVSINGFKHDPMAPFGGFKQSGIGREFGSYGMESFLELKAVLN